jgi:hypothetical protein
VKDLCTALEEIAELRTAVKREPAMVVIERLLEGGYGVWHEESSAGQEQRQQTYSRVQQYLNLVRKAKERSFPALAAYAVACAEKKFEQELDLEPARNAVRIMNLHKAKGLEAEIVILAGSWKVPRVPKQQVIRSGYGKIVAAEKENQSVLQIGDLFANMMAGILKEGFQAPAVAEAYIRQISRWLYFIDALDDYDEDLKKHRFNPIAVEGVPYRSYLDLHYPEIAGYLESLYSRYDGLCRQLDDGSFENEILISILKNSIPAVTALIMHQRRLPELLHCRSGNQWRAKT